MKRILLVVAVMTAGCGGGGSSDAGSDAGTFVLEPHLSSIQQGVFRTGCAAAACHDSGSHQANLVLTDAATSYARLVNQPAYEVAPKVLPDGGLDAVDGGYVENICESLSDGGVPMLVVPGDPDHSFLIWKLTGQDASGHPIEETRSCGQMPKVAGAVLPADQLDAIRQWIANGAPND